jgi:predicted molibdopterin-dependent oxidoreductase YjgC
MKVERFDMFKRLDNAIAGSETVALKIAGKEVTAFHGETVAAAMLAAGFSYTRLTPEKDKMRGPYCMMGICFDCLVEIDGVPNQRACQTLVQDGMRVNIQNKEGGLKI